MSVNADILSYWRWIWICYEWIINLSAAGKDSCLDIYFITEFFRLTVWLFCHFSRFFYLWAQLTVNILILAETTNVETKFHFPNFEPNFHLPNEICLCSLFVCANNQISFILTYFPTNCYKFKKNKDDNIYKSEALKR